MTSPLIETESLVKTFDRLVVLRKLNLQIARGEFVALLGPNGSGKSTLIRLLAGLTRASSGQIRIGGWELPREAAAVRAQIGLVSHQSLLYENLTARENLRFFAQLYGLDPASRDELIMTGLKQVGLSRRADTLTRTFSRGMQQRLSIARALLHKPDVLLLDEPYTGLDQDAATILDELLLQAHSAGHTILMSTHQIERAAELAQRVLILNRGTLSYDAAAAALNGPELAAHYADLTARAG